MPHSVYFNLYIKAMKLNGKYCHTTKVVDCTSHETENTKDETVPWYYANIQLQHKMRIIH